MTNLFISYAHSDNQVVVPVALELQRLGFSVWIDRQGIWVGTNWQHKIVEAIKWSDYFLLFVSFNSVKSDYVRREVSLAFKYKKIIMPIIMDDAEIPPKWDYQTIDIQWVDMRDEDWMSRLLVGLGNREVYEIKESVVTDFVSNSESQDSSEFHDRSGFDLERAIEVFAMDFVTPEECDEVSFFLRDLEETMVLKPEYLYLEYSLKAKILDLSDQIDDFRKVCNTGSDQAEEIRRDLLYNLEDLFNDLINIVDR